MRSLPFKSTISEVLFLGLLGHLIQGCSPTKFTIPPAVVGQGALAISPTSIHVAWQGTNTASQYQVLNLNLASKNIFTTGFTRADLSNLNADTDYALSVVGVRGANYQSSPLSLWNVHTWPDFSKAAITVEYESAQTTLHWEYSPWIKFPATEDAEIGTEIVCAFVPKASTVTDISQVNPFIPAMISGAAVAPILASGSVFTSSLTLDEGFLDPRLAYVGGCKVNYVDGTSSTSANRFEVNLSQVVQECPSSVYFGNAYSCSPNVSINSLAQNYSISIDSANTCPWIAVSNDLRSLTGTPQTNHAGTCRLAYTYALSGAGLTSSRIFKDVVVSAPPDFTLFPSFAVQALSGALAFPHLSSVAENSSADRRARIKGDIISDFGNSTLFAGGTAPFPSYSYAVPFTVGSTFFYGFPVAPVSGGVRPNGFSLDSIRSTVASTDPAREGFVRGNLVVPKKNITDSVFLTATGRTNPISLYYFLSSNYTTDAGVTSSVPLITYLSTNVDFPVNGVPTLSPWQGKLFERATVTIRTPTVQTINKYLPSSGTGQQLLFQNANAGGITPTGLVAVSGAEPYVVNCQANPNENNRGYMNPIDGNGQDACLSRPSVVSCYGDIIVKSPLRLVNAVIQTDANGCRIYATGTVFIQGTLQVSTPQASESFIQVSSASAVIIGFSKQSLGVSSLGVRTLGSGGLLDRNLAGSSQNPFLTSVSDAAGSASAALNAIANDVKVVELKDTVGSNDFDSGDSSNNFYPLSHLVVHAPYVFSNYAGTLTGSVISQVFISKDLNFIADPFLVGKPMFPLYTGEDVPLQVSSQ